MKRLIRKSEINDGFKYEEEKKYTYVFINPTDSEIERAKNQSEYGAIRGVIYDDGTIIVWRGDILHNYINDYIKNKIDIDQYRFAFESGHWIIDGHRKYTGRELADLSVKYKDILNRMGNISDRFVFYYTSDGEELDSFMKEFEAPDFSFEELWDARNQPEEKVGLKIIKKLVHEVRKMKRLIRKSSLIESFKDPASDVDYAIYVNPNSGDIDAVKTADKYKSVTGVIYEDSTMYIWPGSIRTIDINNFIQNDININQFRFYYNGSNWSFNAFQKYTVNEIKEKIIKNKNKLIQIGQFNSTVYIEDATDQFKVNILPDDLFNEGNQ